MFDPARAHTGPVNLLPADTLSSFRLNAPIGSENSMIARRHSLAASAGIACALAVAGAALPCAFARADDAASSGSPGTWQSHKYSFQFMGFTSTYSCDGLADKLRMLLLAAGARGNLKSQAGACAYGFGRPDKFARADLTFSTLAPAQAGTSPGAKPVNGAWRAVAFASFSPQDLHVGDCELVEQFRSQILPMFTTRNVVSNTTCIPNQESGSTIDLKFEVFAPVAAAKH
jgi:hypothetical protein